jgi:hypothetical protein
MKSLTIEDLAHSEQLDRSSMAAVRGGLNLAMQSKQQVYPMAPSSSPSFDSSIHATQDLRQIQQVLSETGDGSAFLDGISASNKTSQFGQNNIVVR